jgi:DNA-directed RNA polymerase sigma subunit (sigma70/sigma32)
MLKYKKTNKKFLTREEEIDLFKRYNEKKCPKLKNEIIENYSALVFFYSKKMAHKRYQYEDIVQEAFLGLSIAIDKFDVNNNCRFMHYAGFWIKAQIFNFIFDNCTVVTVPASPAFMKGFWKIKKMSDMSSEEISQKLNLPIEQVEILKNITSNPEVSLDAPARNNNEGNPDSVSNSASIKKTLENMSITSFEDNFLDKQESNSKLNRINKQLKLLKPQEKDVVLQYFMEEKTFDEISKTYNVTRQRIEQIQKSAIKKIQTGLSEKEI